MDGVSYGRNSVEENFNGLDYLTVVTNALVNGDRVLLLADHLAF